jgi:hypothetical protein
MNDLLKTKYLILIATVFIISSDEASEKSQKCMWATQSTSVIHMWPAS